MPEQPLSKRILVVDDQETDLMLLRRFLKLWSDRTGIVLEITERTNGESALGVAQSIRRHSNRGFDLVITDNSMPKMTGIAFLRALRQQDKETPVLLRSGDPEGGALPTEVQSLGALFLEKDSKPDTLFMHLDRVLKPGPLLIVVADDDTDNCDAVAARIEDAFGARVQVHRAQNGQEILDWHTLKPGIVAVVTDKDMPICDGLGATISLRRRGSEIPVAIMTGRPHDEALIDGATIYHYTIWEKGPRVREGLIPWLKEKVSALA